MSSHPTAATASSRTPLDHAYTRFLLAVGDNRPHELRLSNSTAALQGRFCDIEAQVLAFADWLEALLEDTAANTHLARREADYAKGVLQDLAGDIRGRMRESVENVAA